MIGEKATNSYATARSITPVTVVFNKAQATKIYVVSASDNLSTSATFVVTFLDAKGNVISTTTVIMAGAAYTAWSGDNTTPYTFVATTLKLTLS